MKGFTVTKIKSNVFQIEGEAGVPWNNSLRGSQREAIFAIHVLEIISGQVFQIPVEIGERKVYLFHKSD